MESQSEFKEKQREMPDFQKMNGLVPAVIQDQSTGTVLMVGYMNEEAYQKSREEGFVYFYSRSRNSLWKKGETSGNYLKVQAMQLDCDRDTLLIKVTPYGNTCHTGSYSCFSKAPENYSFLQKLQEFIEERKKNRPENSYTTNLFDKGLNKIAQKVGEEAVELVIEAKDENQELFLNEAADLLYHMLVLFAEKGTGLEEAVKVLEKRHAS